REEGKEAVLYVVGRKGVGYYRFRGRPIEADFTGFSEQPTYDDAKAAAVALIERFTAEEDSVDEIHIVFTEFVNTLTQRPVARGAVPVLLEVTEEAPEPVPPL